MSYSELAPQVQTLVDTEEITTEQARNSHNIAIILTAFLAEVGNDPMIRAMFENNSREAFIEGLQNSVAFKSRFAKFVAAA